MEEVAEFARGFQACSSSDADALDYAKRAWPSLFSKLSAPCAWDADGFDAAFDGLLAYRQKRAQSKLGDDALTCTFLVECLIRLVLLDCFGASADDAARAAFAERRAGWEAENVRACGSALNGYELAALTSSFIAPISMAAFSETFDDDLDAWRAAPLEVRRATVWLEAAYACIFLRPAGQFTDADNYSLLKMAHTSAESAMRIVAVASLRRGSDLAPPLENWNRDWMLAKTRFAGDEMSNTVRRASMATRIPSYVRRMDAGSAGKTEHELAAQWLTKYANDMKVETEGGPAAMLARGGAPSEACTLAVWDYVVQQRLKFSFKRLFWVTDQQPGELYQRMERYVKDTIVNPPPLLVTAWDGVYVVCRHPRDPTLELKMRYKTVGDAIDKWCRLILLRRQGAVFANANVGVIYRELFDIQDAPEQPVVLHTKTLDMD
jgi:hypothetical protein